MDYLRHAKGVVAVSAATAACHGVMSGGYAGARDAGADPDASMWAGSGEFLLSTAASWMLMPLLLWLGMRLLGEESNTLLVLVGGLLWLGVSGHFVNEIDRDGGHIPVPALVVYILLGAALAGVGSHREND